MITITQLLEIKEFPFDIYDSKGNHIYHETQDGYWSRKKYNSDNNLIYYENSNGYWVKSEYDSEGNRIHYEDTNQVRSTKKS